MSFMRDRFGCVMRVGGSERCRDGCESAINREGFCGVVADEVAIKACEVWYAFLAHFLLFFKLRTAVFVVLCVHTGTYLEEEGG